MLYLAGEVSSLIASVCVYVNDNMEAVSLNRVAIDVIAAGIGRNLVYVTSFSLPVSYLELEGLARLGGTGMLDKCIPFQFCCKIVALYLL